MHTKVVPTVYDVVEILTVSSNQHEILCFMRSTRSTLDVLNAHESKLKHIAGKS